MLPHCQRVDLARWPQKMTCLSFCSFLDRFHDHIKEAEVAHVEVIKRHRGRDMSTRGSRTELLESRGLRWNGANIGSAIDNANGKEHHRRHRLVSRLLCSDPSAQETIQASGHWFALSDTQPEYLTEALLIYTKSWWQTARPDSAWHNRMGRVCRT